jgi:nicotinate-nucleotide adenylyltransferase
MARVGILGGTFDPIHLGHLIPAQYAYECLGLDSLILVPSASPVHRPRHIPAAGEHRIRMCELAAASLPHFSVSDVEVRRTEPSYTVLTLRHFRLTLPPGTEMVLLVGEDNLPLLHTWCRIREVATLATLAVMPRPCEPPGDLADLQALLGPEAVARILARRVPGPLVPVSATQIRTRIKEGQPVAGLLPHSVAQYIAAEHLYV